MKIAIDGPAGSGKSTIAKRISQLLNITYIDTGAMYRAITYYMINNNINFTQINLIEEHLDNINLDFNFDKIYLNNEDISKEIRTHEVTQLVSEYSKVGIIRKKMQQYQRNIAINSSVVMDGRDIGTVVLYDADLKIFLTATVQERARRRLKELADSGYTKDINILIEEIKRRDLIDSTRKISPLLKAEDAIEIDTSNLSINKVIKIIMREVANVSIS